MRKKKIIIYDDEDLARERYRKKMEKIKALKKFEIVPMDNETFKGELEELNKRRKAIIGGIKRKEKPIDTDEAEIFVVDFRLMEAVVGLNGEEVAYNLLCFSDCEYVIGLNRYHMDRVFDLTLIGHLDSYADLNISYLNLGNSGLWTGESMEYRPWYWPAVLPYLKNRRKQIEDLMDNFKEPISSILEIPEHVMKSIPYSARAHLGIGKGDIVQATFEDFFCRSEIVLTPKERKMDFPPKRKAKIIASRLSKWIEKAILPGQDILVDAPHLVFRYPSLLRGKKEDVDTWNKTTKFKSMSNLGIHYEIIKPHLFKQHWASRPVWFWPGISEMPEIEEIKEPWKRKDYEFVFTEDASSFYKKEKCRSFISNVESPFRMRYIFGFGNKVDYRPAQLMLKRL